MEIVYNVCYHICYNAHSGGSTLRWKSSFGKYNNMCLSCHYIIVLTDEQIL